MRTRFWFLAALGPAAALAAAAENKQVALIEHVPPRVPQARDFAWRLVPANSAGAPGYHLRVPGPAADDADEGK